MLKVDYRNVSIGLGKFKKLTQIFFTHYIIGLLHLNIRHHFIFYTMSSGIRLTTFSKNRHTISASLTRLGCSIFIHELFVQHRFFQVTHERVSRR